MLQLEMERFSLSKGAGTDKATAGRKAGLDRQLKQLKKEQKVTRAASAARPPFGRATPGVQSAHSAAHTLSSLLVHPALQFRRRVADDV